MAKLTSTWIKHNLIPVYAGFDKLKREYKTQVEKELLAPVLDKLPKAPEKYTVSHNLGWNFATFYPNADVYDKNGKTGKWETERYSKEQQEIIDSIDKVFKQKVDAWVVEFVNNNEVLQRVLKEQPRLQKKYDRAYKRVCNTYGFNDYLYETQSEMDEDYYGTMTEAENVVHDAMLSKPIDHVLWDDYVDFVNNMSIDYADMEEEYVA